MRNPLVLALTAITIFLSSCTPAPETAKTAPTPAAPASASPTEDPEPAIRKLVEARDRAVQQGDMAAIDRIYSDDYISTSAVGLLRTKAQVIEDFKSGALKVESITSDDLNVRIHGDMAIVTGRTTTKGQDRGRDIAGQNRFTQVYHNENGRWRLVAFHYSRIPQ